MLLNILIINNKKVKKHGTLGTTNSNAWEVESIIALPPLQELWPPHSNLSFKLAKLNQGCHYNTDRSTKGYFDRRRSTTILMYVIRFHTTAHSLMNELLD